MNRLLAAFGICFTATLCAAPLPEKETPPLLIVSNRTGNPEIFLMNADGTGVKNLTNSKSVNAYPAWSPDRQKIAFASDRDGSMQIYVMDADGLNVKQLTKTGEVSRVPSWSPDGKKMAFCRHTQTGVHIFVMDADGSNVKQIGQRDGYDPAWSPDGKQILFTSFRNGRGFRLYVMDTDGGNLKELAGNDNPIGFVYPSWSTDGKQVTWAEPVGNAREIFIADADGKNARQLTKLGGFNHYPAWSPDGKKIAFHHYENAQTGTYYVMDPEGSNIKELLKNETPIEGGRPVWRPR
jgi:TolB protein